MSGCPGDADAPPRVAAPRRGVGGGRSPRARPRRSVRLRRTPTPQRGAATRWATCGTALLLAACSTPPPLSPPSGATPVTPSAGTGVFRDTFEGGVTASVVLRGAVRHAGLGLPVVSPDGRWVASLESAGGPDAVDADAPLTGRGLGGVSLWVRGVDEGADRPASPSGAPFGSGAFPVALEGASSPVWGADGLLWFVSTLDDGAALVSYDPRSGQLRRRGTGLRRMLTPAPTADGRSVCVVGHGGNPESSLLFRVDLARQRTEPGPPPAPGGRAQVLPTATAGGVLFVELREGDGGEPLPAALRRWGGGAAPAADVAPLPALASVFDAASLFAGVASPLSPDGRWLLFFDASAEPPGLQRVDLRTGAREPVAAGGTAAAWWSADRLAVAVEPVAGGPGLAKEPGLRLVDLAEGARGSVTLLPGRWAPRWVGVDPAGASVLAVTPGERPDRLKLVQLYVVDVQRQ